MTPRTPARSSLRKTSSYGRSSSGGTPTDPPTHGIPDSGFASAVTNRVRFSPSPLDVVPGKAVTYVTDWSPVQEQQQPSSRPSATSLFRTASAGGGGGGASTQPIHAATLVGQAHHITESDLKRDFDFYRP